MNLAPATLRPPRVRGPGLTAPAAAPGGAGLELPDDAARGEPAAEPGPSRLAWGATSDWRFPNAGPLGTVKLNCWRADSPFALTLPAPSPPRCALGVLELAAVQDAG